MEPTQQLELVQPTQTEQAIQSAPPKKINTSYCPFREFEGTRMTSCQPESKTIPNTGPGTENPQPQSYFQIPFMYNFGSTTRILNDLKIEGPVFTSKGGIQARKSTNSSKMEYSMLVKFDLTNDDHTSFIRVMDAVFDGSISGLEQHKVTVKQPKFTKQNAEVMGLKSPVHRQKDPTTGDVIEGRAPSMFVKLFEFTKPPYVNRTQFTGLDGVAIDWDDLGLKGQREVKFIPILHVRNLFVGSNGKVTIRMCMTSALVVENSEMDGEVVQSDTAANYKQQNPEAIDRYLAQRAKLEADKQDRKLVPDLLPAQDQSQMQMQPTFSGINNGDSIPKGIQSPFMHSTQAAFTHGTQSPSMQDFTAGAPQRICPSNGTSI